MSKGAADQRTVKPSLHSFIPTASSRTGTASAISALPVLVMCGCVCVCVCVSVCVCALMLWVSWQILITKRAILLIYFLNSGGGRRGSIHTVSIQTLFSPLKGKFIACYHPVIVLATKLNPDLFLFVSRMSSYKRLNPISEKSCSNHLQFHSTSQVT